MKEASLAKRYAEAYLSYAKEAGLKVLEAVRETSNLKILLYQNPEFYEFLRNTDFLYLEKCSVIDNVLLQFSAQLKEFLKLLVSKGRIRSLIDICDYLRVNYTHPGVSDALVKTSFPLDLELIARIKDKLEAKLKKKLQLYIELDAELLGGVQVTVGNKVFDGWVRKRLDDLREKLELVRVA